MTPEVAVAGHICLDIIPEIRRGCTLADLQPGKLIDVGQAMTATGGTVSNTGLALHRLGLNVRLMGKVGDDLFGSAVLQFLRNQGEGLADGMIVAPGEATSYSVVLNPPGEDRVFLHCPGANDTFCASDLNPDDLDGVRLLHFGYPPLMRRMFADGGDELTAMLKSVKQRGVTTSLDMALPDPASPAGKADWRQILAKALPQVDVFLPSLDEIQYMLGRPVQPPTPDLLASIADELIGMGVAVVVIKLGEDGLYFRTTDDRARIEAMGAGRPADIDTWTGCELIAPCYKVNVVGATGAGDCTIAGTLAGLIKGLSPSETVQTATAVGAFNVEKADAVSGIPSWETVRERLASGWQRHAVKLSLPGWTQGDVCTGPNHR